MKRLVRPVGMGISRMVHWACQPDAPCKGDFTRLPNAIKKSINQINNALRRPHTRNGTKAIVVNAFLSSVSTIVFP